MKRKSKKRWSSDAHSSWAVTPFPLWRGDSLLLSLVSTLVEDPDAGELENPRWRWRSGFPGGETNSRGAYSQTDGGGECPAGLERSCP